MTFFSILTVIAVLFATAAMSYVATAKASEPAASNETEAPRQRQIPKPWSTLLIAVTVAYCVLMLAGLSYAGWFRVA